MQFGLFFAMSLLFAISVALFNFMAKRGRHIIHIPIPYIGGETIYRGSLLVLLWLRGCIKH